MSKEFTVQEVQKINTDLASVIATFTEWDRRYRENPKEFMSVVEHLTNNTAWTYGQKAGLHFTKLLEELQPK